MLWKTGRMGFIPEFDDLSFDELAVLFDGPPIGDFAEASQLFYEEVAMLLRERDADLAVTFLVSRATGTDTEPDRLAGALFGLSWRGPSDSACRPLLVENLSHTDDMVVQEAIDGLAHIEAVQDDQRVAVLADHVSPYVRGAVLRYWQQMFGPAARPRLLAGLEDPDPVVRFWALDTLDNLCEQEENPVIERLALDHDPDVAGHARAIAEIRREHGI